MGIRIQPLPIDIPEDDPFKNDLLGRKDTVEVLTHLLGSIEGPCILAVDAPWGTGKTTFLKMWSQHLRNNNFRVVEFNAWETDFSEDPFVAISAELTNRLHDDTDTSLSENINVAKKAATKVALRAIPGLIRVATAGILDVAPLLEKEIGEAIASYAKDRLAQYQETRQSVEEFKTSLHDLAATVASSNEGRPLVLVIDELDRCRPSYAVELLEVAKHFFLSTTSFLCWPSIALNSRIPSKRSMAETLTPGDIYGDFSMWISYYPNPSGMNLSRQRSI